MRTPLIASICLLLLPAAAGAGSGVELTLATGLRRGEATFFTEGTTTLPIACFTTPCILAEARADDGEAPYTLILDVPLSSHWLVEALLSQHDGRLAFSSDFPLLILEPETWEATTLQIGMQRRWGDGRVRPFTAAGLGATRFRATSEAYDVPFFAGIATAPVDERVLSGSLAAGALAGLGGRFAARLEARAYWHDLPARLGGTLRQSEASVGLTYRW